MKRIPIAILLIMFIGISFAQNHDAQWVIGGRLFVLDFRNDTLVNYPIDNWMSMVVTAANICSEDGELLAYTNGIFIADKYGNLLQNGDGLSPCPYTTAYQNSGLNIQ